MNAMPAHDATKLLVLACSSPTIPPDALQAEPASTVRRFLADLCPPALQARQVPQVLLASAQALGGLLADADPAVIRSAVAALTEVMRMGLVAHGAQVGCRGCRGRCSWL